MLSSSTIIETVFTADNGIRIHGFQDRTGDIILGGLLQSTPLSLNQMVEMYGCSYLLPAFPILPAVMAVIGPLQSDVSILVASSFHILQMSQ